MTDDLTHDVTGNGIGIGAQSGDERGPAPRQPVHRAPAPADRRLGLDRPPDAPPDPTPVHFTQQLDDTWLDWSVVEVDARAVPGAHGDRCLVFTRRDCIRRVWDYPTGWRALDDAGLVALTGHR